MTTGREMSVDHLRDVLPQRVGAAHDSDEWTVVVNGERKAALVSYEWFAEVIEEDGSEPGG